MKIIKGFLRLETSKKLTLVISVVWVMSVASSFVMNYLERDTVAILTTVSATYGVVLGMYFNKSKSENLNKYNNSLYGKIEEGVEYLENKLTDEK